MTIQTLSNGTTVRDTQSSGSSRVRDIGNIAVDTTVVGADGENIFVAESSGGAFDLVINMAPTPVGTEVIVQWSIDNLGSLLTMQEDGVVIATQIPVAGVLTNTAFAMPSAPASNLAADIPANFAAGVLTPAGAGVAAPLTFLLIFQKIRPNSAAGTRDGWICKGIWRQSA
jgi:hypothetical protein